MGRKFLLLERKQVGENIWCEKKQRRKRLKYFEKELIRSGGRKTENKKEKDLLDEENR